MWWVDVISKKVAPDYFIKAFSLPRSLEPMFQNEVFDGDRAKRVKLSEKTGEEGDAHGLHHAKSLSVFVQSMHLEKLPIVQPHPGFINRLPWPIKSIFVYLFDKLTFMYSLHHKGDEQFRNCIQRAENMASVCNLYCKLFILNKICMMYVIHQLINFKYRN